MWAWLRRLFGRKTEKPLTPGTCVCDHARNVHVKGRGRCVTKGCDCQIYIPRPEDNVEPLSPTPSPEELEELYTL